MVIVNLEITVAIYLEIEQTMPGKQFEHVIEKWQACIDCRLSNTIERKGHTNVCLFGLALDAGSSIVN